MSEHYIFEFDIAMDDHLGVHILDALGDLADHDGSGLLGQAAPLLQ